MSKPRVLYVEDDSINAYVMRRFLQSEFEITVIDDGFSAIDTLRQQSFDIILLDINLGNGKMDGVEVMKTIRGENLSGAPIFAITSFAMPGDEENFLAQGFDNYISKPVEKEAIIKKINEYISDN